eukprot:4324105-Karenia_brevis.AAC.1
MEANLGKLYKIHGQSTLEPRTESPVQFEIASKLAAFSSLGDKTIAQVFALRFGWPSGTSTRGQRVV